MSDRKTSVTVQCRFCKKDHSFEVPSEKYEAYVRSETDQLSLMPEITLEQTDLLCTGMCNACYPKMYEEMWAKHPELAAD